MRQDPSIPFNYLVRGLELQIPFNYNVVKSIGAIFFFNMQFMCCCFTSIQNIVQNIRTAVGGYKGPLNKPRLSASTCCPGDDNTGQCVS